MPEKVMALFLLLTPTPMQSSEVKALVANLDRPALFFYLSEFAIAEEVLGEAESKFYFRGEFEYYTDTVTVQERYQNALAMDLPPCSDLNRFPCEWVADHSYEFASMFASQYEGIVRRQLSRYEVDLANTVLREALPCKNAWETLSRCRSGCYPYELRVYLGRLRTQLDYRDYYEGRMPPPVPLYLFRRLD